MHMAHTHTHSVISKGHNDIPGYNGIMSSGMEVNLWVLQMNTNYQLGNGPEHHVITPRAGEG